MNAPTEASAPPVRCDLCGGERPRAELVPRVGVASPTNSLGLVCQPCNEALDADEARQRRQQRAPWWRFLRRR